MPDEKDRNRGTVTENSPETEAPAVPPVERRRRPRISITPPIPRPRRNWTITNP